MIQFPIEELRAGTELLRDDPSPIAPLVVGEGIEIEAFYFRAVELAFDSIPAERWLDA